MDVTQLIRDSSSRDKVIKVVDGKIIAGVDCQIHVPFRYIPAKLAKIGKYTTCVGIFPVVYGNRYMVSNVCASLELFTPSVSNTIINGEEYYVFSYTAGETISPRNTIVVSDEDVYNVFNELIGKAKIPWFLTYEDVGKCIANAHRYGNITLSGTNAVIELIVASICRNKDDINQYYRTVIKTIEEQNTNPALILPFKSVIAGTTNTVGKLLGAYFDEGMTSALTQEGGPPGVEDLFRL